MEVGTKSLLFGVHQFFLHPFFVLIAWCKLYGRPSWRELICIVIHDWGYWGKPNMDGEEGERHPERGARLARMLLDRNYLFFRNGKPVTIIQRYNCYHLCLFHSRHYSRRYVTAPSKLCWADKLSVKYMPAWLYLLLGNLSGEISEYRKKTGLDLPPNLSDLEWHREVRDSMINMAEQQNAEAMPYMKKG